MTTIRDVAKRAGVSSMTVSRVINGSGYTSEATRAQVQAAVADMGYVPNGLARQLRLKQTKTLALVLSDITNPFFTAIARGVEDTASEQGYSVIYCNTDDSEEAQARQLNAIMRKQVDGIIMSPAGSSTESLAFLNKHGIPVVLLDRSVPDAKADVVRCDSEQAAYQLVRLLVILGHKRIAVLAGPDDVSTANERVAGYRRALAEAGVRPEPRYELRGASAQISGQRLARQVLNVAPPPTAIFAGSNSIAIGALKALRDAGLAVPDDIAVVAFDDLPPAWVIDPFLTAAAQPAYQMGQRAVDLLLARVSKPGTNNFQDVVLPAEIIVRRSSAPPRKSNGG